MRTTNFFKYQGAGNDFILIDGKNNPNFPKNDFELIQQLCDRKFGIGADGLIILEQKPGFDFEMLYYNADGRPGSMCGNGGRCIVAFAHFLQIVDSECHFLAIDGPHKAKVITPNWIELEMKPVYEVENNDEFLFMNTGSPHYIEFVEELDKVDVFNRGRTIRYNDRFQMEGTNVNFVETTTNGIKVATYERGVEAETLACGTGVTAAAIAHYIRHKKGTANVVTEIQAKGGTLQVKFSVKETGYEDIWLCGPAKQVFQGTFTI